ncbi:hypothetical protein V8G54_007858 [Vigna mungo]|uniref:Uncharacterized protein n=1 Tax=Vigna mungo TaxID=3915 RepID=A0AAQ3S9C2_VIGMU
MFKQSQSSTSRTLPPWKNEKCFKENISSKTLESYFQDRKRYNNTETKKIAFNLYPMILFFIGRFNQIHPIAKTFLSFLSLFICFHRLRRPSASTHFFELYYEKENKGSQDMKKKQIPLFKTI